jgi:hypothetical protein
MTRDKVVFAALVIVTLALSLGVAVWFSANVPGGNDWHTRWAPVYAWTHGIADSPYAIEATQYNQLTAYGKLVAPGDGLDPGYYVYPMYFSFIVAPFTLVSYEIARAIWMVVLGACMAGEILLAANLFGWRLRPAMMGIALAFALMWYPAGRGILLGQPGLLVAFLTVLALWALDRERDILAGVTLALSTVKPTMNVLLIPCLVLWGLRARRWRFLTATALTMIALVVASWLFVPTWIQDMAGQILNYPGYTDIGSPANIITHHYLPFLGDVGEFALQVAALTYLAWAWRDVIGRGRRELFHWAAAVTLTITNLIAFRTATTHYVIFLYAFVPYWRRWMAEKSRGAAWVAASQIALFVTSWALPILTGAQGGAESPLVYVPLPLGMIAVLAFTRGTWETFGAGKDGQIGS